MSESKNEKTTNYTLLLSMVFFCIIIWGIPFFVINTLEFKLSDSGLFGDTFGVVSALFNGLAFAGLIFTLHLQRKDLDMQREELGLTRDEMSLAREEMQGQKEQLTRQAKAMERQAFESHFFHMLDLHKKNTSQITRQVNSEKVVTGKRALMSIWNRGVLTEVKKTKADWIAHYERVYPQWIEPQMGDYFRTLYHIFSFVDASDLDASTKKRFANIIRAQLNNIELGMLFVNCLTAHGKGFVPLICRYGIFQHLDVESLQKDLVPLKQEYDKSAFGS